ncbi:MarR family winged helix-turn-helix transcriptional regulator [Novosphingobium mangrovi (ex Hu et al. 2023)]|uniref:MarR family transcriptional regulator n=1 Tax=Novosphingobium mangrovi (ex Hu et al. 2023) TaxID=2930094 RepID=A0ABT0AG16_9SPHN|nr:MarR family transcriptional regulator [Novosphingobium mangrovi (ex Hu et al. 2023)]MCJ1962139.1 MarR family transcriptional regulator [Novosphingobium mangrovi (ex Hu et al. 2023)]
MTSFRMEQWPFYWMTQFTGSYLRRIELGLKGIGLDIPRWRVLMSLRGREALSVSEIADHAIVKLPTMTKIIQRMQAENLVIAEQSPTDGRVTEVRLTSQGHEAGEKAWAVANRIYRRAFEEVTETEIADLNVLLRKITANLAD